MNNEILISYGGCGYPPWYQEFALKHKASRFGTDSAKRFIFVNDEHEKKDPDADAEKP